MHTRQSPEIEKSKNKSKLSCVHGNCTYRPRIFSRDVVVHTDSEEM